jgi:hypothetical protein
MQKAGLPFALIILAMGCCVTDVRAQDERAESPSEVLQEADAVLQSGDDRPRPAPVQRTRFLTHFMRADDGGNDSVDPSEVRLWYLAARDHDPMFDRGLSEIREAEASFRTWTTYRDDDVVIQMSPFRGGWRILLPINRREKP